MWLQSILDAAEAIDACVALCGGVCNAMNCSISQPATITVSEVYDERDGHFNWTEVSTENISVGIEGVLPESECSGGHVSVVGSCRASLRIGILALDVGVYRYFQETLVDEAHDKSVSVVSQTLLPLSNPPDRDALTTTLAEMRSKGVNVLINCVYVDTGLEIIQVLQSLDWTPLGKRRLPLLPPTISEGHAACPAFCCSTSDGARLDKVA